MLADLFKPAWQSPSVDKRLKAVAEMDGANAENEIILFDLAKDDEDASIRLAAIERLRDLTHLSELLHTSAEDEFRIAVGQRLDTLISSEESLDKADIQDLLQRFADLRPRIAAHAALAENRLLAVDKLADSQKMQVLGDTAFTDTRQSIAEQLGDIDDLEVARKVLRGKDKKAERIVKRKIEAYREHQRQQTENKALVDKLTEEVEYLAGHEWLPEFKARCAVHRQQWDGIDFEVDADSRCRYLLSREKVETLLKQQRVIEETHDSQQQLVDKLQNLLDDITGRELPSLHDAQADIELELDKAALDWTCLAKVIEPEETINSRYFIISRAINSSVQLFSQAWELSENMESPAEQAIQQLEGVLKKFDWPSDLNELRVVSDLKAKLVDCRNKQKATADEYQLKLNRVHRNINKIFHLGRAGNLPSARHMAQKVEKALEQIEAREISALQERYKEALKVLEDMGDWKNYATEPKYLELCESMERLIDSDSPEEKRYEQMKALQKQWKTLGYSDVSEQHWPRFKEAADKVYQPCAEFFQQRRQIQKANLDKRQQFVEQMRELLEATDWENHPDYKAAQSKFYGINNHFTGIKDVEHRAGQKQWRQFSSLKDQVKSRLDEAYDENIEIKKRLISQAQQLAEAAPGLENIDKLKTLQARWSQVGITRRKQDQKAWVEFKSHCDTVYNEMKSLRRSVREVNDQKLNSYRRIIQQIQKLAKNASNLAKADHQFRELQDEYHQLPELPEQIPQTLIDGIRRDFVKACGQYEKRQQQIEGNQQLQQIQALREKAGLCEQLEANNLSSCRVNLEQIAEQWQAIVLDNPALDKRIELRRESTGSDLDRAEIGVERRMLCIRLEIALDVDSPAEDRDMRMQYQLQQMNQSGFGQQAEPGSEWFKNLELDWLCMPGAEPAEQRILDQRFQRVLRRIRKY